MLKGITVVKFVIK